MSLSIKLFGNRYYLKTHQTLCLTIINDEEISVLPVKIELSVFLEHFFFGTHFMLLVLLTKFRNFYAAHLAEDRFEKAHMISMRDIT